MSDDRIKAAQWAQRMLQTPGLVILDTETTGLQQGEIVQIALINRQGETLMDTFVKPAQPIPPDATKIHGITDLHVAQAYSWKHLAFTVLDIIQDQTVVVYNATYDRKMMYQSNERQQMLPIDWRAQAQWQCAMEQYARFWGGWNDWHESYRWQKLTDACAQQNIPDPEAPAHSALGDCLRTLALLNAMAKSAEVQS